MTANSSLIYKEMRCIILFLSVIINIIYKIENPLSYSCSSRKRLYQLLIEGKIPVQFYYLPVLLCV